MTEPAELLEKIAARCSSVFLWTVFFDPEFYKETPEQLELYSAHTEHEYSGFKHKLHKREYGEALDWNGFCGGPRPYCNWMEKDDILGALRHFGFSKITAQDESNIHGSALRLVATKG